MSVLEQALEQLRGSDTGAAAEALGKAAANLDEASRLWTEFLEEAPPIDNPFTFLVTFGAARARRLHELHLEGRALAHSLTEATGIRFADALEFSEELDVVQAYSQVRPGDTAESVARAAIDTLGARRERVLAVVSALGE